MTLNEAKACAVRVSRDNRCCIYVNGVIRIDKDHRELPINYYTSDWFNSDSTVLAFSDGKALPVSL